MGKIKSQVQFRQSYNYLYYMIINLEYRDGMNGMMESHPVEADSEKSTIVGRVIAYNSMSKELRTMNGDKFQEIILPGALDVSLSDASNDILALVEHDTSKLLGRRSSGTLTLESRADGLYATILVPDTSYGEDLLALATRGDIKGFSFGFTNPVSRNYSKDGIKIREISKLDLKEVSIVASPAYNETALGLRNEDFVEETKKEEVVTTPAKSDKDIETEFRFRFLSLTHI